MKRATFFKSAGSSSPEQAKAKPSRQSIRGRISAPIPIPDLLEQEQLANAAPAAPTPEPIPVQEAAAPEEQPPAPTSPPPPTRVSPPPPARASPAPPVVSAFSEDLENSDNEIEAETDADEEAGAEESFAVAPTAEKEAEVAAEQNANVDVATAEKAAECETPDVNTDDTGPAEAEDEPEAEPAESMPPLQSPKVRVAAYHRRIPTAELAQRPQEQPSPQQQQLPLPHSPPHSPSPPQVQYQLPQAQPGLFRQAPQPMGSSPPPLSSGPSAVSSTRASGTASAGNSAASPAFRHRTNPSSTLRYSGASGVSSGGAGTSAGNTVNGSPKPQRKKSTLRGAFSKLFSRRKKTDSQILPTITSQDPEMAPQQPMATQQQQQQQQVPQHRSVRSDPTILSRPRDGEPKRSASLPITEYDRALRSHSIGPDDIIAIGSARNSFQTEQENADGGAGRRRGPPISANRSLFSSQGQGARRRFNNKSEQYGSTLNGSEWTGLSPRPVSAHARRSQKRLSGSAIGSGGAGSFGRNSGLGGAAGTGASGLGLGGAGFNLFGSGAARNATGVSTDPNEIGRAITSNGPDGLLDANHDMSSRRRSRSLSGLHDLALDQAQSRDRKDEIRYWRESYDPAYLSPLSSHHDMSQDVDDDDNQDMQGSEMRNRVGSHDAQGDNDITGAVSLMQSLPDSPMDSPIDQEDATQSKGKQQPPKTPPQPFSFGNLASLGANVGISSSGPTKITQAHSMDSRLGGLETRMHRMERVVGQLCNTVPGFKESAASATPTDQIPRSIPPFDQAFDGQPAIPPIPAIYQSQVAQASSSRYSNSRHSAHSGVSEHSFDSDMHSHMSFGDGQTYIGSLHPPSSSATQAQSIMAPAPGAISSGAALSPMGGNYSPALRPTSTSTVRGATSLPALNASVDSSVTADLMAQLESERAVRQTLETQVKKLNERVNALSTTMYAMLRDPAAARPSTRGGSREALGTTPSSVSLRGQSAAAASVADTKLKAESVLQTAKALGHGLSSSHGVSSFSPDIDTESDGFQTPLEDMGRHYNYNYTDDHDTNVPNKGDTVDDTKRKKKAARTLSLGQLTLGKSAVQT
ncbi:hypothetical protein SEUCBS139899_000142 [Sporothrix eucalyptigena]|uniref:Uncharacterized protein n=1 Tax=Sporothrix eucalyptigena TaxID=1812306 RepID=A0ABP0C2H9_9PEZI